MNIFQTIDTILVVPFVEMLGKIKEFVPTLSSAFLLLVVGLLLAKFLHDISLRIFKDLHVDKFSDKVGLSTIIHNGGIKAKPSDLISSLIYIMMIVMFLIMTLEVIGLRVVSDLVHDLVSYVPQVISSVFVLVLGMVLAKVMASIVYTVAQNMHLPKAKLHADISYWAIIIYAAKMCIEELGLGMLLTGPVLHIIFAGVVLALALAFGLGGKDSAAKYLIKK